MNSPRLPQLPEPEQVRRALENILSQRQFSHLRQEKGFWEQWWDRAGDWLNSQAWYHALAGFIERLFANLVSGGSIEILILALKTLAVLLFLGGLFYLYRVIRGSVGFPGTVAADPRAAANRRRPDYLEREAGLLESQGRYLAAMTVLLLALLRHLDQQNLLAYNPARTNREVVGQLGEAGLANLSGAVSALNAIFEIHHYALRPCGAREFDQFTLAYRRCLELLNQTRMPLPGGGVS